MGDISEVDDLSEGSSLGDNNNYLRHRIDIILDKDKLLNRTGNWTW